MDRSKLLVKYDIRICKIELVICYIVVHLLNKCYIGYYIYLNQNDI